MSLLTIKNTHNGRLLCFFVLACVVCLAKAFSIRPQSSSQTKKVGKAATRLFDWPETSLETDNIFAPLWTYQAKPLARMTFSNE